MGSNSCDFGVVRSVLLGMLGRLATNDLLYQVLMGGLGLLDGFLVRSLGLFVCLALLGGNFLGKLLVCKHSIPPVHGLVFRLPLSLEGLPSLLCLRLLCLLHFFDSSPELRQSFFHLAKQLLRLGLGFGVLHSLSNPRLDMLGPLFHG